MSSRRTVMLAAAVLSLCAASCRAKGEGDWEKVIGNFVLVWSDGTVLAGREFDSWRVSREEWDAFLANKDHDEQGISVMNARFGGRPMFSDEKCFARLLRNTNLRPVWTGPFVQMKNGDILPGLLTEGPQEMRVNRRRDRSREKDSFITVVTSGQLCDTSDGQMHVRADAVARIALVDHPRRDIVPGLIVYNDGREVLARSIKLEKDGVQLLLVDGVAKLVWEELAEIHLPHETADNSAGNVEDEGADGDDPTDSTNQQAAAGKPELRCRLVTSNGAILTYPMDTCLRTLHQSHHNTHFIWPHWANRALRVPLVLMVSQSFFYSNEVPLSLLPATMLSEKTITGHLWRWRRNENVRGSQLACGQVLADLGIGMHSHCEVAFELPADAISFSGWVGIDEAVGNGGCVRCKVFLDEVAGNPAWSSGYLCGRDDPVRVTLGNLRGARRLILVAEFADKDHPPDADPFDLRDEVAWLMPLVNVSRDQ